MRRRRGFTLLEIMVVIVIIAILLAIMIPTMVRSKYQAHLAGCEHNERALASSLEIYHTDNHVYPTSCTIDPNCALVTGQYLRETSIACPSNQARYSLETNAAGDDYTITCHGAHFLVLTQIHQNFPQYNAGTGLNPTGP